MRNAGSHYVPLPNRSHRLCHTYSQTTRRCPINAEVHTVETTLEAALTAHQAIPARVPLAEVNAGQRLLGTETKLIRTALAGSGDIIPDHDTLHIRLDPLSAQHSA